jgi:hypothetical protein
MPAREQQGGLAMRTIALETIPQDRTGPVTLSADLQLTLAAPNGLVLETARRSTKAFYRELMPTLPRIENGLPVG